MQALRHAADKATENLGRKDGATSGIGDKGTDAVLNGYTVGRVKQVTAPSAGHLSDIACGRGAAANGRGGHPQIVLLSLPEHIYRGVTTICGAQS